MVDVMSAEKRSALMSRIRGKNTTPEWHIRRALWHAGFRYRLHSRALPGKPDIVLRRWNAVVLVHGCFWHRHEGCPYFKLPKTRPDFWNDKLRRNRDRDNATIHALAAGNWRIAIVWECALRASRERAGAELVRWVGSGAESIQIEGAHGHVATRQLAVQDD